MWYHHDYWGMHAFWWLFWLLGIGGLFWLMSARSRRGRSTRRDDALDTLRRRYASGEIDEEEYERRREILAGHPRPPEQAGSAT